MRKLGGDQIAKDLLHGSEAYLEMWERAIGVPAQRPLPARVRLNSRGLDRVEIGVGAEPLLRSAGSRGARREGLALPRAAS